MALMFRALVLVVATVVSVTMGVATNTIDVPGSMVWFRRQTGGLGTLDTLPLGGADLVHELLARLGIEGRALYLSEIVWFDIAFPIALLTMVHLATTMVWSSSRARVLVALPWIAFAIDMAENASAAVLTMRWPDESLVLAETIGWLTAVKFVAYGAGVVAVVVGIVRRVLDRRR